MKQKKITLNVFNADGQNVFHMSPCAPDHVISALTLFSEIGYRITIDVEEIVLASAPSN